MRGIIFGGEPVERAFSLRLDTGQASSGRMSSSSEIAALGRALDLVTYEASPAVSRFANLPDLSGILAPSSLDRRPMIYDPLALLPPLTFDS